LRLLIRTLLLDHEVATDCHRWHRTDTHAVDTLEVAA
jgi:hypothetical protein